MVYVNGEGSASAQLMVVGEAPGEMEEAQRRPFVGPTGQMLDDLLRSAGVSRSEVYLTNVVKVRPPQNDIKRLHELGKSVEDFLPQLWDEVAAINPNCILALGNTALKYLTGYSGIIKYRGSILQNLKFGLPKVVPTIHPASLLHGSENEMRSWKDLAYIRADVKRAVEQSKFRDLRLPERVLLIARNSLDLIRFFEGRKDKVSIDVETCRTIPQCIAFAFDRYSAISVPLLSSSSGIAMHDLMYIWRVIAEFVQDTKVKIIGHNLKFDEKRCRDVGLKFHDVWFDTMLAWHVLYPELPKKLQFVSSILTEEPYYKDEGSEFNPQKDSLDRLLLYNAKDAVVTFECYEKIRDELKELNLLDWFFENMMPLHRLYSDLEDVGLLVDQDARKRLITKYHELRNATHEELVGLIGHDINVMSPKQIATLLFGELRCPVRKDTQENTLKALANNAIKDEHRKRIIKLILEERKIRKTIGTYLEAKPSSDGRMRTQYQITGTESGRTSTTNLEPPVSVAPEGMALQTLTKHEDIGADLRDMFIADPGYVFIEADLSQAEDRVSAVLAKDWEALKLLEKKEFVRNRFGLKDDRHTLTAMLITGKAFDDVTDEDRQIGKRARHAANYGIHKHQLMITLSKYGIFISEWKAGKILEKIHMISPNIRNVFHAEVQQALADNDCVLISPYGRRRQFLNKWGDELFKEAYSAIPQTTVSDHLKLAMLRIRKRLPKQHFHFVLEAHDSFTALCKIWLAPHAIEVIHEELNKPISFRQCSLPRDFDLVIPAEVKVGTRLSELVEYKREMD